jgi:hypothetical protein
MGNFLRLAPAGKDKSQAEGPARNLESYSLPQGSIKVTMARRANSGSNWSMMC